MISIYNADICPHIYPVQALIGTNEKPVAWEQLDKAIAASHKDRVI